MHRMTWAKHTMTGEQEGEDVVNGSLKGFISHESRVRPLAGS